VTDTGAPAQTNIFITHLDEVEAFLRKDADTRMPPGSAANRALQIDAIGKTRAHPSSAPRLTPLPTAAS
jgi:hypothetical protein